ncbi:autotransporter-associated N-terminal domain-containing protein, partial [Leptotrichia sp. OH3620_COT-345]|uniref:autotransporter-associated N-terminal domain-containing protein n=1 Tax=Leptotrichia sp. OH3620_COT-345 TaxID=2491048 RepID=UPI000F64D49F
MSNNLKKMEKDLRALAKRCKDVKYTKGLLLSFLLMGMLTFSEGLTPPEVKSTENAISQTRKELNSSINDMHSAFKQAKRENNRLLKNANLELIQLMEQGDQVVKSPWSSWQFGMNYFYSNWRGAYKGRGDKKEKYPYEGILERDKNEFNRYVSPLSSFYNLLAVSADPTSASSNARSGLKAGYGLASNKPVLEPVVELELNAGITPRPVAKGALVLTPPTAATPTTPTPIDFKPTDPTINPPQVPTINIAVISAPATGNGDDMYIKDGGNNTALAGSLSNQNVGMIAQYSTSGGTMDVTVNNGATMDISTNGVTFTGHKGASHNGGSTYSSNLNTTGYTGYSAMKLVGGHEVKIENTTINVKGAGTNYQRWLFHTDGHNDHGESTWNIGNGSTINLDGLKLAMYTSQYHGNGRKSNIGFINNGTINSNGADNYLWIALDESGSMNRVQYFANKGTITLNGDGNVFVFMDGRTPHRKDTYAIGTAAEGGYSIINEGALNLNGKNQRGIIVNSKYDYPGFEILLNRPINISGESSVGAAFTGWADLDGGLATFSQSADGNRIEQIPLNSRESVFNMDLSGTSNVGMYFNYTGTKPFTINDYTIKSTNGEKNILVFINDGIVNLSENNAGSRPNSIKILDGKSNIGIYTAAADDLMTGANIEVNNSDSSTGIFSKSSGTVTNTGNINASGKSIKAIIADGSVVNSTGAITVDGKALSASDGSVGLAAMNGATLTQSTGVSDITVDGSASIGAYSAGAGSTLKIADTTISTTDGAFNTYAKGGTVEFNANNIINTGQKSLAFYTDNTGVIKFTAPITANIAGGTDSNSRGTAFLYKGAGYSPFDSTAIGAWATSRFNGMNNLTLNMASGSRLFIAQDVAMNLSDTSASNLAAALGGATINGTDYKSFMLYLSKLAVNQSVDLDNANDAYNQLEISNSSIENNNSNTITGTQAGQVAMAQANQTASRNNVQLTNSGNINLSGANSTAIYGSFAELTNAPSGIINIGDSSTALYGENDSLLSNEGTINLGNNSTGLYVKGATTGTATNSGTITSTGTKAIGITFDGTGTGPSNIKVNNVSTGNINLSGEGSVGIYGLGNNYQINNSGTITLGDASNISNPNVGIFTDVSDIVVSNGATGKIKTGNNSIGIFGYEVANDGEVTVGDGGIGIYSKGTAVRLVPSSIVNVGNNEAVGVYLENGGIVTNDGKMNIGDNSYGFVAVQGSSPFNFTSTPLADITLGNRAIYVYSNDVNGTVTNNTALTSTTGENYGLYSAGTVTNNAPINFGTGIGNVGVYSIGGGTAVNNAPITIGASDTGTSRFGIGMATDNGNIVNNSVINVNGNNSIGMYATGTTSTVRNAAGATINLAADGAMGIYLDNGATGVNDGTITTVGTPNAAVGVVVRKGSSLVNNGTININSPGGYAQFLVTGGTVRNHGTITIGSGAQETFTPGSKPTGKEVEGVEIKAPAGSPTATISKDGILQPIVNISVVEGNRDLLSSSFGMYIDTLKGTNPILGLSNIQMSEADLIIGSEAAEATTSKYIEVNGDIIKPYNDTIAATPQVTNWKIYSGSFTWLATATLDQNTGLINNVYLAKIPYTAYAGKEPSPVEVTDTYNFLDGLEQRYGVEGLGTREKALFNKLNNIGKNEEALFYQATDEMMGHQYANVQQRINRTGTLLDKEFT